MSHEYHTLSITLYYIPCNLYNALMAKRVWRYRIVTSFGHIAKVSLSYFTDNVYTVLR